METFTYKALSVSGEKKTGTISAEGRVAAIETLSRSGLSPYFIEVAGHEPVASRALFARKLSLDDKVRLLKELSTLLQAGITLDRALKILNSQSKKKFTREIIMALLKQISSGKSLSQAMSETGQFEPDVIGLLGAGEQSGMLLNTMNEVTNILTQRREIKNTLISALIYPAFLLLLAPVSFIIITIVLVPSIASLFDNPNVEAPALLRFMLWLSNQINENGLVLLVGVVFIFSAVFLIFHSLWKNKKLEIVYKNIPLMRTLYKRNSLIRLSHTLALLLKGGISLQNALLLIAGVVADAQSKSSLKTIYEKVSSGEKLSDALKLLPFIDDTSLQMISIGEETNKLEDMLLYISSSEEKSLKRDIERIMSLVTPMLTVIMGFFIGGLVMTIMRAILSINDFVVK